MGEGRGGSKTNITSSSLMNKIAIVILKREKYPILLTHIGLVNYKIATGWANNIRASNTANYTYLLHCYNEYS